MSRFSGVRLLYSPKCWGVETIVTWYLSATELDLGGRSFFHGQWPCCRLCRARQRDLPSRRQIREGPYCLKYQWSQPCVRFVSSCGSWNVWWELLHHYMSIYFPYGCNAGAVQQQNMGRRSRRSARRAITSLSYYPNYRTQKEESCSLNSL